MISFARALGSLRELVAVIRAFRLDDGVGLPPADPGYERAGRRLMIIATLLLGGAGLWEIAAPFAAGHYAASTAVALAGENMWHFGVIAPVPRYLPGPPSPSDYYCHHPFGMFWTAALFSAVFGHHDWVCRLPAVLMSTSMPWLIHRAARAAWGPIAGGLAALTYAVLPITLAYAAFFALEVPTMFGMALGAWALVRFFQAGTNRYAVFSLVGLGYAACVDWPGMLFTGLVLGGLFLRGFVLRRFFAPVPFERFATLWASLVALLAAIILFHAAAIAKLDQLGELMRQGEFRALGADRPLEEVLASRAYWIALAFTPFAIGLGKVAAPILAVRLTVRRSELELFVLALLGTAIFQYVVFKQGADIHFFWPQYFALYAAYAVGALAVTLEEGVRRQLPARAAAAGLVALALGLGSLAAIAPDGLVALLYARKTGGRFNEKGLIIHPDVDKQAALEKVAETLPDDAFVGLDGSMKQMYWMDWTLRRPVGPMPLPKLGQALRQSHFALDLRFAAPPQASSLIEQFQTRAYGPYLVADLRAETTPLEGHALVPREPTLLEQVFVSSSHARYEIVPDPFLTWELRHHFDRTKPSPPAMAPQATEQLRVAHNIAVLAGDTNGAARLRERLLAGTERGVARDYTDGVSLLAWRFDAGASDFFTVYFEAGPPLRGNYPFGITSHVEHPRTWSPRTPPDDKAWDVGMPFVVPTTLWVEGFIYAAVTEILGRPGRERYDGAFRGRGAPVPVEGPAEVTLFTRN